MASADAMTLSECISTEEILRLKRELVSDDLQGHSCDKCEHISIVFKTPTFDPITTQFEVRPIFRFDTTPAEICGLAASGCNFWIMIRDRLASITRDDELNGARSWGKRGRRWSKKQNRILAASSAGDEKDAYVNLESLLEWGEVHKSEESDSYGGLIDPVRVIMKYHGYEKEGIEVSVLVPQRPANTNTHAKVRWLHLDETITNFRVLLLPNYEDKVRCTQRTAPINLNPDSSTSMELHYHWLKVCEFDHKCGIRDPPESMPSLILNVDESGGVKLIQFPATMKEPYVALSYCWGFERQRTVLTRSNRPDLLNSIDLEDLDRTISDSITVTRALGFRYLWIDALCIVQDDEEFKSQELEKMGDIYRNAALTIIASGAKDVTEGFLHRRTSTLDRFGVVPGYPQPVFKFHEEGAQTPVILVPYKDYDEEPWYQRAWTLQEMLFSKRRLQFGLTQTTWCCHCHGDTRKECDGWLEDWYSYSCCGVLFYLPSVTEDDGFTARKLLLVWFDLIQRYSSRQLRYRRDRLPAISAIAREASSILGNYTCGLWTSHLPTCLAWYRDSDNVSGLKGAPSWSWASHEGEAVWEFFEEYGDKSPNQDFMLLSHNVDLVIPGDPFGEVRRAELHVRGLLLPTQGVIGNGHGNQWVKLADGMVHVYYHFDYRDIPGEQPDTRYALSLLVLVDLNVLEGAEGIIVLEEAGNRYSRVGWFEFRGLRPRTPSDEDDESEMAEDKSAAGEDGLRHRLRQLGGGKKAIREFVLI